MSDFTPEEMMTLRVATRSYMESMRTNAITFASEPDTGHYFTSEAERAEELWNKLVQMDLRSIHAAREALAEAVMKDDPDYREDADSDELKASRKASDEWELKPGLTQSSTDRFWVTGRGIKHQYPRDDRPMHGPF